MNRLEKVALALALSASVASGPALADVPRPTPSPASPVSLSAPVPARDLPGDVPVVATSATVVAKDPAAGGALQPNANPSALLFLGILNSGGTGRYGR